MNTTTTITIEPETKAIKDGDIFRWRYLDDARDRAECAYWGKSQVAIASGGYLTDTYWSDGVAARDLILEYLGNLADLDPAGPWKAQYYDDADIVDIRHTNASSGNFYIRKGAVRSKAKMLEMAQYRREMAISDVQSAARRISEIDSVLYQIRTGDVSLDDIYL